MRKEALARLLLERGIIKTNFQEPILFKSGIMAPIYCNFRACSGFHDLMETISDLLTDLLPENIEVVIGVATGGISHATLLAERRELPSGYIRPDAKAKDYGLKNLIEGCPVSGREVGVIEDLVSTAGSAINNAQIIMKSGANGVRLYSIFSYDMDLSKAELATAGFTLESLLTIHDVMPILKETLSSKDYASLEDWVKDPVGWFNRHKTEFEFGFLTQLRLSAQLTGSIVSMGIDPVIEALPEEYAKRGIAGAAQFYTELLYEMKSRGVMMGMIKPNDGFYAKHVSYHEKYFPGYYSLFDFLFSVAIDGKENSPWKVIPLTADAKRGDIGKSSQNYAEQFFVDSPWHAITVSPYMGYDSVSPFINFCNPRHAKGVYVLNLTSNEGRNDFQMMKMSDGRFLYQHVSDKILAWAQGHPGVGAVIGGNIPAETRDLLAFFAGKNVPALIPGVGSQGGSEKVVADSARETGYELDILRINAASSLSHPWFKKAGDPIPSTPECIEMSIQGLIQMNENVGYKPIFLG